MEHALTGLVVTLWERLEGLKPEVPRPVADDVARSAACRARQDSVQPAVVSVGAAAGASCARRRSWPRWRSRTARSSAPCTTPTCPSSKDLSRSATALRRTARRQPAAHSPWPALDGHREVLCRPSGVGPGTRTNTLESLVIADFVCGPSVRDVEALLADALGSDSTVSKSTVNRICEVVKDEFDTWRSRELS